MLYHGGIEEAASPRKMKGIDMPVEPEATSAKLKRVISYRIAVGFLIQAVLQLAATGRIDDRIVEHLKQCARHV